MTKTGLLGGSFNPAHRGHRRMSLEAMRKLGLDEVWWLVSPGNPLKDGSDMAPLGKRFRSAVEAARRTRIKVTAIERRLGTRYTAETLRLLLRRFPDRRFIWLMGADNLVQFHRWKNWRALAALVPIAVVARPGYDGPARRAVSMGWLRHFARSADQARNWATWRPPAIVLLSVPPDPTSATALRAADPDWHQSIAGSFERGRVRDGVTRRPL